MTPMEETMKIERLDRSKPPPGWTWASSIRGTSDDLVYQPGSPGERTVNGSLTLKAAWAHHEPQHDPPGMRLVWEPDDVHFEPLGAGEWHVEVDDPNGRVTHVVWFAVFTSQDDVEVDGRMMAPSDVARAASWRWYWLADGGEVLEVLR